MVVLRPFILSVLCSVLLIACGGGGGGGGDSSGSSGYSGSTSRATVDSDNADDVSRGAVEAANRAEGYDAAPVLRSSNVQSRLTVDSLVEEASAQLKQYLLASTSGIAARVEETAPCATSGTVTIIFPNLSPSATTFPQTGVGTFIYNNCLSFDTLITGSMTFSWSGFDEGLVEFINLTITYDLTITFTGEAPESVKGTISCTNYGNSCVFSEDFVEGGIEYRIENVEVSGNNISGYTISARIYHEAFGYVDIVATNITYCANGNIQTGNIQITDSTDAIVVDVDFVNCDEYTVTYGGVSTVYNQ